jgi:hypothetical protein
MRSENSVSNFAFKWVKACTAYGAYLIRLEEFFIEGNKAYLATELLSGKGGASLVMMRVMLHVCCKTRFKSE